MPKRRRKSLKRVKASSKPKPKKVLFKGEIPSPNDYFLGFKRIKMNYNQLWELK